MCTCTCTITILPLITLYMYFDTVHLSITCMLSHTYTCTCNDAKGIPHYYDCSTYSSTCTTIVLHVLRSTVDYHLI